MITYFFSVLLPSMDSFIPAACGRGCLAPLLATRVFLLPLAGVIASEAKQSNI